MEMPRTRLAFSALRASKLAAYSASRSVFARFLALARSKRQAPHAMRSEAMKEPLDAMTEDTIESCAGCGEGLAVSELKFVDNERCC